MTTRSRRGAPAVTRRAPRTPSRRVPSRASIVDRILVLSGPNLDRLGKREPEIYGSTTLAELHTLLAAAAKELGVEVVCRQSNHEGELIDWINAGADEGFAAIVLNPAGLTHTSIALHDSIKGSGLPVVEVHISNPDARESFRRRSRTAPACVGRVAGFGAESYILGLRGVVTHLRAKRVK
jgi:3-dehydroquinate dehydratase-2